MAGHDIVRDGPAGARGDRRRAAGGGARPAAHRARAPAPADDAAGPPAGASGARAATSCSSASGSTDAADRKVRRLLGRDEAPARPRARARPLARAILFLDEPTTGLDPQSRADLWEEVGAARARRGRDRVPHHAVPRGGRRARRPRRDHRPGQDRRRGHAGGAEGRDRAPDGRGRCPSRPRRARRGRRGARAASAPRRRRRPAPPPCGSRRARTSPRSCARSTREDLRVADLQLHEPSLDDVFLAKTGPHARRPPTSETAAREPGRRDGAAARSLQTLRQPAMVDPADPVPAVPDGDQRRRPERGDAAARASRRLATWTSRSRSRSCRARCSRRSTPASSLARDVETGLPEPPGADADAARGAAGRQARRRR